MPRCIAHSSFVPLPADAASTGSAADAEGACDQQPHTRQHREEVGGHAAPGAGRPLDGIARSDEGRLERDDPSREEGW